MKAFALLLCAMLSADAAQLPRWRPDPGMTPGAIQATCTAALICKKGYSTKSVRPDEAYTEDLKKKQIAQYGYADTNPMHYEEDHLASLELCGHPTDPRNLWPEIYAGKCGAHVKDKLENKLHELVCAGKITLAQAQSEIAHDWVQSYNLRIGKLVCS